MTYLETTLGELALAQIRHREAEGLAGLPEVHIPTDEGRTVILTFSRGGDLVRIEVETQEETAMTKGGH